MKYRIEWDRVGAPTGFFILRFDEADYEWWVLDAGDSQPLERATTLVGRNKYTLEQPSGDPTDYPGLLIPAGPGPTYAFDDTTSPDFGGTHYQIVSYYASRGAWSNIGTAAPASSPGTWDSQGAGDNLIRIRRRHYRNWSVNQLRVLDASGTPRGRVFPNLTPESGSYAALMTTPGFPTARTAMLEVAGSEGLRVEGEIEAHDIAENVVEWS